MLPHRFLQLRGVLSGDIALNRQNVHRTAAVAAQLQADAASGTIGVVGEVAQVWMWDRWAQNKLNVEMAIRLFR